MRPLSYAFLTSASFAALAIAAPANAQTPDPVNPDRDPCQAPADQRDPNVTCPTADSPAGEAIAQGAVATPADDEGVVVVGSRIRRDRFNTADPVTIINRDAAVDAGFNSTAEVLQSVGVTGGTGQINDTFGGLVVEGGPGVNTLSLRGLGPTRTLILLNGRGRYARSGWRGRLERPAERDPRPHRGSEHRCVVGLRFGRRRRRRQHRDAQQVQRSRR